MQDGNKYAPFQTFSDAAFAKRTVEDGIGKAKRQRLLDTIRHPDFKPEEMVVTSEKRRDAVMQQFPGVQRRLPDVWQIPVICITSLFVSGLHSLRPGGTRRQTCR